jgi:hypothetical protein
MIVRATSASCAHRARTRALHDARSDGRGLLELARAQEQVETQRVRERDECGCFDSNSGQLRERALRIGPRLSNIAKETCDAASSSAESRSMSHVRR